MLPNPNKALSVKEKAILLIQEVELSIVIFSVEEETICSGDHNLIVSYLLQYRRTINNHNIIVDAMLKLLSRPPEPIDIGTIIMLNLNKLLNSSTDSCFLLVNNLISAF